MTDRNLSTMYTLIYCLLELPHSASQNISFRTKDRLCFLAEVLLVRFIQKHTMDELITSKGTDVTDRNMYNHVHTNLLLVRVTPFGITKYQFQDEGQTVFGRWVLPVRFIQKQTMDELITS
jgi:hypothetical protein